MFDHDSERELLLLQINYIPFWAPQPQAIIHTLTLCNAHVLLINFNAFKALFFLSFVYHNNCYRPHYMKMVFQKLLSKAYRFSKSVQINLYVDSLRIFFFKYFSLFANYN